jgi:hypothetical protein
MERREEGPAHGVGADPVAPLSRPCPRFATRDEWETWHASLTWEEQLRRGELDAPQHEYSDADIANARAREERRQAHGWDPDPFSYADERGDGPWPRVDQIEAPALSNTLRMDSASGYSPGGFARRMRQVPYHELIEERMPARAQRDAAARAEWLLDAIAREEASLRAALKRVLRDRHGRLTEEERGATSRAMAWSHLLASRSQLRALHELFKERRAAARPERLQLALF